MNVIFLDFDGVLNSTRSVVALMNVSPVKNNETISRETLQAVTEEMKLEWHTAWENSQWVNLDRIAIGLIDTLCREAPAKVVISSTWRMGRKKEDFQCHFKSLGFEHIEVIGKTPILDSCCRGEEIYTFILDWNSLEKGEPITEHVILDDDSDMLDYQKRKHFVHVPNNNGMLLKHYRDALRILNPKHPSLIQFEPLLDR